MKTKTLQQLMADTPEYTASQMLLAACNDTGHIGERTVVLDNGQQYTDAQIAQESLRRCFKNDPDYQPQWMQIGRRRQLRQTERELRHVVALDLSAQYGFPISGTALGFFVDGLIGFLTGGPVGAILAIVADIVRWYIENKTKQPERFAMASGAIA